MNAGILGALGSQSPQQGLSIAHPARLHINVGEPDHSVGRVRIKRHYEFVFALGGGEFFLPLVQQTSREMRFGILRCELGCLTVSRERVFRLFIFQQMRKRKPFARTSSRPMLRFDSKTSGLAATDLR